MLGILKRLLSHYLNTNTNIKAIMWWVGKNLVAKITDFEKPDNKN